MEKFTEKELKVAYELTKFLQTTLSQDIRCEQDFFLWGHIDLPFLKYMTQKDFIFNVSFEFNLLFMQKVLEQNTEIYDKLDLFNGLDCNSITKTFIFGFYIPNITEILEENHCKFLDFGAYKSYIINFDTKKILLENIDKIDFSKLPKGE